MMTEFCGFPCCENEAEVTSNGEAVTVPVSPDPETVELRSACHPCNEAHASGVQYGQFRAVRLLLQKADELSRSGAHTEANCYRLAAEVIESCDDPGLDGATPEED